MNGQKQNCEIERVSQWSFNGVWTKWMALVTSVNYVHSLLIKVLLENDTDPLIAHACVYLRRVPAAPHGQLG